MTTESDRLQRIESRIENIEANLSLLRDILAFSNKGINKKSFAFQAFLRNFTATEIEGVEETFIWGVQNQEALTSADFLEQLSKKLPNYREEIFDEDSNFWRCIVEGYLEQDRMPTFCKSLLRM